VVAGPPLIYLTSSHRAFSSSNYSKSLLSARILADLVCIRKIFFSWSAIIESTCEPDGNTDEELCNRWMQLSAFTPFYRNHNIRGAIPQEPYRWDSVANSSRTVLAIRYSLLPYWVRAVHKSAIISFSCVSSTLCSRTRLHSALPLFERSSSSFLMSLNCSR